VGTLAIEYVFLVWMVRPTISLKRLFLYGFIMSLTSHAGIIVVYDVMLGLYMLYFTLK